MPSPQAETRSRDTANAARRIGLYFATPWLIFLYDPAVAIAQTPPALRLTGYVALIGFIVAYLRTVMTTGRAVHYGRPLSTRTTWLRIAVLISLTVMATPAAGAHSVVMLIYVVAAGAFALPLRHGLGLALALGLVVLIVVQASPDLSGPGIGIGFTMAAVASWAGRRAQEHQAKLLDTQDELAELALQQERARIAADLHDILGHSLTVITIKAELARRMLDGDLERARSELEDLERLSRDALADVRATAHGMRGGSLPGAIAAARVALTAAGIDADLPTATDEVPTHRREVFAWTVREAVTNVVRHSHARHCSITLSPSRVEIVDDGSGLPPGDDPLASGHGLAGLRHRVEAAGAELTIGSPPTGRTGFCLAVAIKEQP